MPRHFLSFDRRVDQVVANFQHDCMQPPRLTVFCQGIGHSVACCIGFVQCHPETTFGLFNLQNTLRCDWVSVV